MKTWNMTEAVSAAGEHKAGWIPYMGHIKRRDPLPQTALLSYPPAVAKSLMILNFSVKIG